MTAVHLLGALDCKRSGTYEQIPLLAQTLSHASRKALNNFAPKHAILLSHR